MTKRNVETPIKNLRLIGQIIRGYREALKLERSSRDYFIHDRVNKNLLPYGWISEKTLMNIENGYNMPSIVTLKYLSIALEVDFLKLMEEIEDHILYEE